VQTLAHVRRTLGSRALFVFIGAEANVGWLEGALELGERGFVVTGRALDGSTLEGNVWQELGWEPSLLETSLLGVFVAGDLRSGSIKRVASAMWARGLYGGEVCLSVSSR
jgi:thioredoxin reductase (NADPH)